MRILERINTVGMAMNILESISSTSQALKDSTKAEIVKQILVESGSLLTKDFIEPSTSDSVSKSNRPIKKVRESKSNTNTSKSANKDTVDDEVLPEV